VVDLDKDVVKQQNDQKGSSSDDVMIGGLLLTHDRALLLFVDLFLLGEPVL
jgi:hypothetical protein